MSVITRTMIKYLESFAVGLAPSAPLQTCVFHLGKNALNPTIDTTLAAITECDFDGYAPVTITTFGPPVADLAGNTEVVPTITPVFNCTGTVTSNTVYTAYLTGPGTLASLLAVSTLTPIQPQNGQQFRVTPAVDVNGSLNACVC